MKLNFLIFGLVCTFAISSYGQGTEHPSLNIGDPAPPLRLRTWLKGSPIEQFDKGKVYLVELWATWCAPCKAAMPHLSYLASEYKDRITILGIDIYEKKTTSIGKIKAFVDSMGDRMAYNVGVEDSNFVETDWVNSSGEERKGIPRSFLVNAEGRVAWIGHPSMLEQVLPEILNNTWDINAALANRNLNRYLADLDDSLNFELARFRTSDENPGNSGNPDSALLMINEMISHEPGLKYAPHIAYNTFAALLRTDPQKAYAYGKVVMATTTYEDMPPYYVIGDVVRYYSGKIRLPAQIYLLAAEACQEEIDHFPYPEIVDVFKLYQIMANWYMLAGHRSKAIYAEQKAIETLKSKRNYSKAEMAALETRLRQYKNL